MKFVRLGDVCSISKGKTITRATSVEGDIPVIGGGLGPTYFHNISNINSPVITISASGANAGFVNFWNEPIWASDCSTITQDLSSPVSIEFIYKFLQSSQEFINLNFRKGSAQPHVYSSDIAELMIPIVSMNDQKLIVEKLDKTFVEIDKLSENNVLQISKVSELFNKMCQVKIKKLNESGFKNLNEISDLITKGTTPTSIGHRFAPEGINFLKVESIDESGGFVYEKFAYIDDKCHKALQRSQLQESDVLVSIAGALGRTALVTVDICPANVNQALALIRLPKDSKILPSFLFSLFQSGYFDLELRRMGAGAAQQNLSLTQIGSLRIPVFPEKIQLDFIDYLNTLKTYIHELEINFQNKQKQIFALRNSVLASIFSNLSTNELVS